MYISTSVLPALLQLLVLPHDAAAAASPPSARPLPVSGLSGALLLGKEALLPGPWQTLTRIISSFGASGMTSSSSSAASTTPGVSVSFDAAAISMTSASLSAAGTPLPADSVCFDAAGAIILCPSKVLAPSQPTHDASDSSDTSLPQDLTQHVNKSSISVVNTEEVNPTSDEAARVLVLMSLISTLYTPQYLHTGEEHVSDLTIWDALYATSAVIFVCWMMWRLKGNMRDLRTRWTEQMENLRNGMRALVQKAAGIVGAEPLCSSRQSNHAAPARPLTTQGDLIFERAMKFVSDVKQHFSTEPQIYTEFLEFLAKYKSKTIPVHELRERVEYLLRDAPDLLRGFHDFLPNPQPSFAPEQRQRPSTPASLADLSDILSEPETSEDESFVNVEADTPSPYEDRESFPNTAGVDPSATWWPETNVWPLGESKTSFNRMSRTYVGKPLMFPHHLYRGNPENGRNYESYRAWNRAMKMRASRLQDFARSLELSPAARAYHPEP